MKARLIRIGNSRGVRLPKPLITEAGLHDEVASRVDGEVVISSPRSTRAGWADAARQMHESGEDRLLDPGSPTHFDEKDWRWR